MADADVREYFNSVVDALSNQNFTQARRTLEFATEEWPGQCDLHRAMEWGRAQQEGAGAHTGEDAIARIRSSLNTFDDLVSKRSPSDVENWFTTSWELPLIPVILPMVTRGQVIAAHAAMLVEKGRYDEANAELAAARREKVVRPENVKTTEQVISVVECLLHYRTSRWEDLINLGVPLASAADAFPDNRCTAVANAFSGAALAHLNSHEAGQTKLRNAISSNLVAVGGWAALQLGLSHRAAGDEDGAQKAFALGLQFSAAPELIEASRNKNVTMRISAPDVIAARTSYWDVATEPDIREFQRQSSMEDRKAVLQEAMAELDQLDGMGAIKERMRILAAEIAMENEQRRRGLKVNPKSRHLIFKGPPGTGKTTVANLVARLYYGLGVIPTHTLVEANRAQLIGTHEGMSADKTKAKLEQARGGVMFIDEAYELLQDRNGQADPYGSEALTTLLEYMEMWRSELVVIVAGYEDRLERFLSENPGLKSRFAYSMSFNTYSPDEVWSILNVMARKEGRNVDQSVGDRFRQIVEVMWDTDQRGDRVLDVAGNGRFARNVFEQAQGLASRRLFSEDLTQLTDEQLTQLSGEDILGATSNILKGYGLANVVSS